MNSIKKLDKIWTCIGEKCVRMYDWEGERRREWENEWINQQFGMDVSACVRDSGVF